MVLKVTLNLNASFGAIFVAIFNNMDTYVSDKNERQIFMFHSKHVKKYGSKTLNIKKVKAIISISQGFSRKPSG